MNQRRILIVEDDEDIRDSLEMILKDEGYTVRSAENGKVALDLLAAEPTALPHMILLDLTMPVMSGSEFLAIQKNHDQWKAIPVVVFTAAGPRIKPELADDFLKKPINLDQLIGVIQKHCS